LHNCTVTAPHTLLLMRTTNIATMQVICFCESCRARVAICCVCHRSVPTRERVSINTENGDFDAADKCCKLACERCSGRCADCSRATPITALRESEANDATYCEHCAVDCTACGTLLNGYRNIVTASATELYHEQCYHRP
jgi:hypothetical protein